MCGIAGAFGVVGVDLEALGRRMVKAMVHRGPDGNGWRCIAGDTSTPPALLAHARLALVDLSSSGAQPMMNESQRPGERSRWISFNGEIFNYKEIRETLLAMGYAFRTATDTEVILKAFDAWGPACVDRMRGMFTWCIADPSIGEAWIFRDRLGIKPLYLCRPEQGGLLFASEVRTLLAAGEPLVRPVVSSEGLESFLAQGAVFGTGSIVDGVRQAQPGSWSRVDFHGRLIEQRRFWHAPFLSRSSLHPTRSHAVAELGQLLRESVQLRLIADVPVGLFLSGGVDSCSLATVATERETSRLQSLSIGFDLAQADETRDASAVAQSLGLSHQIIRLSGDEVLADMSDVFRHMDQPTVDGFNTFFVARAVRRTGLKAALSGVGGDELFGGYASFRDVPTATRLARIAKWVPHPPRTALSYLSRWGTRRAVKAADLFNRPATPVEAYLLRRELFFPWERRLLHQRPSGSAIDSGLPLEFVTDLMLNALPLDSVNQVSSFEIAAYMRQMLLRDADVMGMAVGLEVRVPLLDHRLVETVVGLPGSWKRPDPRPKPLLLDAVGPRLPSEVWRRPKRGFTFPWGSWLRGAMASDAKQAIADPEIWRSLNVRPEGAVQCWDRFERGDRSMSPVQILGLWCLSRYARQHNLRSAA